MCVELEVRNDADEIVWHQLYSIDEIGNEKGTAMSRLVSLTVSIGVESILAGQLPPGVAAAPHQPDVANGWLQKMTEMGESFNHEVVV